MIDQDACTTYVNQPMAEMLGYTVDDMQGKHLFTFMDTANRVQCQESLARGRDGAKEQFEFDLLHRHGHTVSVLMKTAPIVDDTGAYAGAIAGVLDITERRQMERALQESEDRFKLMMQQSPSVIEFYDLDGLQVEVNRAYEELWGFPASHTVGKFNVLASAEVKETGLIDYVERAYAGEAVTVPEYEFDSRGETEGKGKGRIRWLSTHIYPLKDSAGTVQHIVITHEDITERKRAEAQMRQAQEQLLEQQRHDTERVQKELDRVQEELVRKTRLAAIGQVSASMAHDLRNPLGSVRNANYLLKRRLPQTDARITDQLRIIDQEVSRADQIITNLLEIARARPPKKTRVDLGKLIYEVLDKISKAPVIHFDVQLESDPFAVQADPDQLIQVISNVLDNAVHAMGNEGHCLIKAQHAQDHDVISFEDDGSGIPIEVRDRLFEPLVTTKARGTGLGLTICKQIMESHGGSIQAHDAQDQGAVIWMKLPPDETPERQA